MLVDDEVVDDGAGEKPLDCLVNFSGLEGGLMPATPTDRPLHRTKVRLASGQEFVEGGDVVLVR